MKRYQFRLDAVLRVRRIEEERAAVELATANRALLLAEQELDRRLEHYRGIDRVPGPLPHDRFIAQRSRREQAAAAVVSAGAARISAEAEAERKRELWAAAAMRVRALERLDERRRAEHEAEVVREEIITLDEVFAARLVGGRR
jgi:flagellar protein FliJ